MTGTAAIVAFLEARYAETESDALAASHDTDQLDPLPGGEHWHWVYAPPGGSSRDGITDQPVDLTRDTEYVGDQLDGCGVAVSLRSVEEYPARYNPDVTLPSFVVWSVDEMPVRAARHIARHDPARVLVGVAAKRAVLAEHPRHEAGGHAVCGRCIDRGSWGDEGEPWPCQTVRALAAEFADHPDHSSAWGLETR